MLSVNVHDSAFLWIMCWVIFFHGSYSRWVFKIWHKLWFHHLPFYFVCPNYKQFWSIVSIEDLNLCHNIYWLLGFIALDPNLDISHDIWLMTYDIWLLTYDSGHINIDCWHIWHMTCRELWLFTYDMTYDIFNWCYLSYLEDWKILSVLFPPCSCWHLKMFWALNPLQLLNIKSFSSFKFLTKLIIPYFMFPILYRRCINFHSLCVIIWAPRFYLNRTKFRNGFFLSFCRRYFEVWSTRIWQQKLNTMHLFGEVKCAATLAHS